MKKIILLITICFTITSLAQFAGCARQPTVKRSTAIMEKYYKKYSKEYPESVLGQNPVSSINVLHMDEIHKDLVVNYAILELTGGMAMQVRFTVQKKPLGWRAVSWENMGIAMQAPR